MDTSDNSPEVSKRPFEPFEPVKSKNKNSRNSETRLKSGSSKNYHGYGTQDISKKGSDRPVTVPLIKEERKIIPQTKIDEDIRLNNSSKQKEKHYEEEKNIKYPPEKQFLNDSFFKSKGLRNNHNNCYFNSVMQVLAHCPEVANIIQIKPFQKLLQNMMNNEGSTKLALKESLDWLDKNTSFNLNYQHDPKELLMTILQNSPNIASFFKWKRIIEFSHGRGIHPQNFPEQSFIFFQINPISNNILLSDLEVSFKAFITSENGVQGFCNQCNTNVKGNEVIVQKLNAKYAIFNAYSKQADCNIKAIQSLNIENLKFDLMFIILRQGESKEHGHNFAMCKESEWVIYNDMSVEKKSAQMIRGVYMLFYKIKDA